MHILVVRYGGPSDASGLAVGGVAVSGCAAHSFGALALWFSTPAMIRSHSRLQLAACCGVAGPYDTVTCTSGGVIAALALAL
jgi:hypothetical protein